MGLSLPVCSDQALSEEVEVLAREIAGLDANPEIFQFARRIAEAQIDLRRVRDARHRVLSEALSDPHYDGRANVPQKMTVLGRLLWSNTPELRISAVEKHSSTTPEAPEKLALILSQEIQRLLVMDRYERRALSRRKLAIRAFDLAKQHLTSR
jgi:hypothetical protein